jgi:stringent starvation protein B
VRIPSHVVRNGKVVLNVSPEAVRELHMDADTLNCSARFAGQAVDVSVPMAAILAIYAQENGQGMMFADEPGGDDGPGGDGNGDGDGDDAPKRDRSHLQVVK